MEALLKVYLEQVKERLSIFNDMYSNIRIVDPIRKISHMEAPADTQLEILSETCFHIWGQSSACENCISMRVYNTEKSAFKIQVKDEKTYLIQAYPVTFDSGKLVVEMLRDISFEEISLMENAGITSIGEYISEVNTQLVTDALTGLYNRRYVDERLPADLYKANASGGTVCIVMADIDLFKDVNDVYGHLSGDKVLKDIATLIKESIRPTHDWVARFGGEEFIIVLNELSSEAAIAVIEAIRKRIENHVFVVEERDIKVTCSFGIHVVKGSSYNIADVIAPADACLYAAKQSGRNQYAIK